jgi:hypothetical protein
MIPKNLAGDNSASWPGENLLTTRLMIPGRLDRLLHDLGRPGRKAVSGNRSASLLSTAYQRVFPYHLLIGYRAFRQIALTPR